MTIDLHGDSASRHLISRRMLNSQENIHGKSKTSNTYCFIVHKSLGANSFGGAQFISVPVPELILTFLSATNKDFQELIWPF